MCVRLTDSLCLISHVNLFVQETKLKYVPALLENLNKAMIHIHTGYNIVYWTNVSNVVMATLYFIYKFLQIRTMVEMHEIVTHGELSIIGKEATDRGEDLFMYYMKILI